MKNTRLLPVFLSFPFLDSPITNTRTRGKGKYLKMNSFIILLCISSIFCGRLYAQEEPSFYRFSIKLQSNLSIDREFGSLISLSGIYPAVQIRNAKGYIHQLEISGFGLGNQSISNTDVRNYSLGAGYEFSIPLGFWKQNDNLAPYIGLGISTLATSYFINPSDPTQFIQRGHAYLTNIYVQPSFQQQISERVFLDFALQIHIGDFTFQNTETQDPSIPLRQQSFNTVTREFFNFQKLAFRFGLGFRL